MASLWQQSQERAAKQMTSNDKQHKDCNLLCTTKFIKSCFMYSCDKHTDTSHAGSYQHHEPVNRVPKIGWASSILPTKLGSANSRSAAVQTVAGYHLELTSALHQATVPQQIHCSPESKTQITTEVLELLNKGAIVETQDTPQNFVSQMFLVEKKWVGGRDQ